MNEKIEEMAREIRAIKEYIGVEGITIGERRVGESHSKKIARHLIEEKGYRKASEVAREIFAEIKASSSTCFAQCNGREIYGTRTYTINETKLDEILKKYESEGWDEVQPS